jgi:uncharacterized protein YegL
MGIISNNQTLGEGIQAAELNVFFVIDNSGSMINEKINALNTALREVTKLLPEVQAKTIDARIKVSLLTFSDDAKWMYNEAKPVEEFKWRDIETEGGTNLGAAYEELYKKITSVEQGGMMPAIGGISPIIILLTDGEPTSPYKSSLTKLKSRGWFKVALKYGLFFGDDSTGLSLVTLKEFTGTDETIYSTHNPEVLIKMIKSIAVNASQIKSSQVSSNEAKKTGAEDENQAVIDQVNKDIKEMDEVKTVEGDEWVETK